MNALEELAAAAEPVQPQYHRQTVSRRSEAPRRTANDWTVANGFNFGFGMALAFLLVQILFTVILLIGLVGLGFLTAAATR